MPGGNATLPLPVTVLTVGGSTVGAPDGVVVDEWGWDYDGDAEAAFHEEGPGVGQSATYHGGQLVTLTTDGTLRFSGEITDVTPSLSDFGWTFSYRARSWRYRLDKYCVVTGVDGSGQMLFNSPPDDDDDIPANDGHSVGQILAAVLTQHAAQLAALGISTDATTTSQLAALTLVPPETTVITGRLGSALDQVLRLWSKNVVLYYTPAGLVRLIDTTAAGSTLSLTEGTDPIQPVRFGYSLQGTASRVLVRGKAQVYPFYASVVKTTLVRAWTTAQQTAWKWSDYSDPVDAVDEGTVSSISGSNTVVLASSSSTRSWPVNFWSNREAWLYLYSSAGTGLTFSEQRPVTANTALTSGGTSTITVGYDLENAGSGAYDSYKLIGRAAALGESGAANDRVDVWRLYTVDDPGHLVANHLVKRFPSSVPFLGYYGDTEVSTLFPAALVISPGGVTVPASFKIIPATGQIRFDEPVVKACNSLAAMIQGGAAVKVPTDVWVLLAYSRGPLAAAYPPDSGGSPVYSGGAYSSFGYEATHTVDVDSWLYTGNKPLMAQYAQALWAAMNEPIYQAPVSMLGAYPAAYDGSALLRVNVSGPGYTTGEEARGAPVRSYRLRYHADAAGGVLHSSNLGCSTRRDVATGDRFYMHPTRLEQLGFKLPGGTLDLTNVATGAMQDWADSVVTPEKVLASVDAARQAQLDQVGPIWLGTGGNGATSPESHRGPTDTAGFIKPETPQDQEARIGRQADGATQHAEDLEQAKGDAAARDQKRFEAGVWDRAAASGRNADGPHRNAGDGSIRGETGDERDRRESAQSQREEYDAKDRAKRQAERDRLDEEHRREQAERMKREGIG